MPTALDNCDGSVITSIVSGMGPGATFPMGATVETYTAIDAAGNSSSCSFTVEIVEPQSTGIHDPAADAVSVYPNPTTGTIYVAGLTEAGLIKVYGVDGKLHLEQSYIPGEAIQLADAPAGIYTLVVSVDGGTFVERFYLAR